MAAGENEKPSSKLNWAVEPPNGSDSPIEVRTTAGINMKKTGQVERRMRRRPTRRERTSRNIPLGRDPAIMTRDASNGLIGPGNMKARSGPLPAGRKPATAAPVQRVQVTRKLTAKSVRGA